VDGLRSINENAGFQWTINQAGSMFTLFFTEKAVIDFSTAKTSDTARFAKYFQHMLHQGIYLAPSQFEAMFISTAITPELVEVILNAHKDFVNGL
jgi:glutamate-1-semialdehyde 2,1-aminomutase